MAHHHHHHGHSTQRIGLAFFLNLAFTLIEFVGGLLTNSTAILADAVHDLGDSLALGMAWGMEKLSHKHPNQNFTYGFRRLSLVAALVNALVLLVGSVWVISHAIPRLWDPQMPVAEGMVVLALMGIAANGYAAYKLSHGNTLNERVLNWHLLEDVLGWVAVLVVAIVLLFVDWPILDPILSIAFTLFILLNVGKNLYTTIKLFIQASPNPAQYQQMRQAMLEQQGVEDVHHMHFWSLDGERHVLTAHVVVSENLSADHRHRLKTALSGALSEFELAHTTIELEYPDEVCRDQTSSG
ncbi:Zinc transporter [Saliniradius amylolyticus]|uniref:Zinc transporter n=1 Tax=Saliniradius amylolyticus TaxID=2183582 RepID=A0A2S2E395_9ALTE|nr:cation diffusion facilitator family transporter [Saliniradius amylolyticus]AWL12114.1 Zinc transporter [Saliniradius amylolyticus]